MKTESQKRAIDKYRKTSLKQLKIEAKAQYIEDIKKYCQDMGVSQAQFILKCCYYFINCGELPPD